MQEMEKAVAKAMRDAEARRPPKPPAPKPTWFPAPKTPYPPEAIERVSPDLIRIWGHLVEIPQDPSSDPPDPSEIRRRDSYYVIDPTHKYDRHFSNPPGAREVRDVLDKLRPVTKDRMDYFAPIDEELKNRHCLRLGWWLYVKKVELNPNGWTAEVSTSVKLSSPYYVTGSWIERYKYVDGELTYLNGWYEPSATREQRQYFRVPRISLFN
jgi:hypothetical protein